MFGRVPHSECDNSVGFAIAVSFNSELSVLLFLSATFAEFIRTLCERQESNLHCRFSRRRAVYSHEPHGTLYKHK